MVLAQDDTESFVYARRWQLEVAKFASGLIVCLITSWLILQSSPVAFPLVIGFLFGAAVCGYLLVVHLWKRVLFQCKLTRHCFSVTGVAAASLGDVFDIAVDEIVQIEHVLLQDGDENWYLSVSDGRRLKITSNYGNPVGRFMSRLQAMRKDLTVCQTTKHGNHQAGGLQ